MFNFLANCNTTKKEKKNTINIKAIWPGLSTRKTLKLKRNFRRVHYFSRGGLIGPKALLSCCSKCVLSYSNSCCFPERIFMLENWNFNTFVPSNWKWWLRGWSKDSIVPPNHSLCNNNTCYSRQKKLPKSHTISVLNSSPEHWNPSLLY